MNSARGSKRRGQGRLRPLNFCNNEKKCVFNKHPIKGAIVVLDGVLLLKVLTFNNVPLSDVKAARLCEIL